MNGIKLFPLNPIFLKILSSNNAILDIYPVVSKTDIHVNNIINCGINPSTEPTPAIIPSTIKLFIHSDTFKFSNNTLTFWLKYCIAWDIKSTVNLPTTPTDK